MTQLLLKLQTPTLDIRPPSIKSSECIIDEHPHEHSIKVCLHNGSTNNWFDMGVLSTLQEKEEETAKMAAQIYKKSNIFF